MAAHPFWSERRELNPRKRLCRPLPEPLSHARLAMNIAVVPIELPTVAITVISTGKQ